MEKMVNSWRIDVAKPAFKNKENNIFGFQKLLRKWKNAEKVGLLRKKI